MTEWTPIRSALVVAVPAATPLVGAHRLRMDPAAAVGVPEHITLLYPFVPPADLDDGIRERLRVLFGGVRRFEFSLAAVEWFGEHVMYVAPQPDQPFVALTKQLVAEFGIPPYEGDYDDEPEPHLTVAIGDTEGARAVEPRIAAGLPIRTTADRVLLMQGDTAEWRVVEEFLLS